MSYDSRDYYRPSGFGGFSLFPDVIKKLLILNVAGFFIQMIFENIKFGGYPGAMFLTEYFALSGIGLSKLMVWQLVTYQFMHADFMHLFWNMFMLWMFGMEIANQLGSKKFLTFYILCGIGAGLLQTIFSPMFTSTIGASGAVWGIMIYFAMAFPDRMIYIYFLFPVRAKYLIGFLLVMEFLMMGQADVVAHMAHLGGALTGFIFIMLDKNNNIRVSNWINNFRRTAGYKKTKSNFNFRKPFNFGEKKNVQEAKFYDINDPKNNEEINQEEIDKILDKISQSGYQNLSEHEKRILFEASKKK